MSASRMSTNCAIHKAKRSPGSMNGSMVSGMTSNTMSSIPTRVRLGIVSLSYKLFCMNFNCFLLMFNNIYILLFYTHKKKLMIMNDMN